MQVCPAGSATRSDNKSDYRECTRQDTGRSGKQDGQEWRHEESGLSLAMRVPGLAMQCSMQVRCVWSCIMAPGQNLEFTGTLCLPISHQGCNVLQAGGHRSVGANQGRSARQVLNAAKRLQGSHECAVLFQLQPSRTSMIRHLLLLITAAFNVE